MKRVVIIIGSLAATGLLAYLAFLLGAIGFDMRRFRMHEGRLKKLLTQTPKLEQVVQGLEQEGSPLLEAPAGPGELRRVAVQRGGRKSAEVIEKGSRRSQTRVFLAADMIYFIYFDAGGVMRDFTCVSR